MKLYIGGAYNGQTELAQAESGLTPVPCTPETALHAPAIGDFHLLIRQVLAQGGDARAFVQALLAENPGVLVVSDEIGLGIVPLDPFQRRWREETGRALCALAEQAERVTRVYCGIPRRLK